MIQGSYLQIPQIITGQIQTDSWHFQRSNPFLEVYSWQTDYVYNKRKVLIIQKSELAIAELEINDST